MSESRISLGKLGEDLACDFLRKHGHTIVVRNYRQKCGEIDIIAKDKDGTLVFVEVKTRKNDLYGSPAAAVTPRKQQQISRVAQDYLCRNKITKVAARFDVVSILLPPGHPPQIDHIPQAFDLCSGF